MNDIFINASKTLDRPITNLNLGIISHWHAYIFFIPDNYILPL